MRVEMIFGAFPTQLLVGRSGKLLEVGASLGSSGEL